MTTLLPAPMPWNCTLLMHAKRQELSIDPVPELWNRERIDVKPFTAYPVLGKEAVSLGLDVFRLIPI